MDHTGGIHTVYRLNNTDYSSIHFKNLVFSKDDIHQVSQVTALWGTLTNQQITDVKSSCHMKLWEIVFYVWCDIHIYAYIGNHDIFYNIKNTCRSSPPTTVLAFFSVTLALGYFSWCW